MIQGDGSFVVRSTRSEFIIYVSQHLNNIQLLYKIKSFIGFGYVRIQKNENMSHYVLQKRVGLDYILKNLYPILGKKAINYHLFLKKFDIKNLKINDINLISFENS